MSQHADHEYQERRLEQLRELRSRLYIHGIPGKAHPQRQKKLKHLKALIDCFDRLFELQEVERLVVEVVPRHAMTIPAQGAIARRAMAQASAVLDLVAKKTRRK